MDFQDLKGWCFLLRREHRQKKAAGRGLPVLRRSPEGGACEFFILLWKTTGSDRLQLSKIYHKIQSCQDKSVSFISN